MSLIYCIFKYITLPESSEVCGRLWLQTAQFGYTGEYTEPEFMGEFVRM
jgi:hypothetical protein